MIQCVSSDFQGMIYSNLYTQCSFNDSIQFRLWCALARRIVSLSCSPSFRIRPFCSLHSHHVLDSTPCNMH